VTTLLRRVTVVACLAALAVTLVVASASGAASAPSAAAAKCDPGPTKISGKWWLQYCGPATSTVRFSGKTTKFTSGTCSFRSKTGVLLLYIGKRDFLAESPKTKYWELLAALKGDGVYRKDVFVEWWLGKTHYVLGNIKMTFKNKQKQGAYTGRLLTGGKGTATGTFKC
jgi:hypothetical protein